MPSLDRNGLSELRCDILKKQSIAQIKCPVENDLIANQPNVFTNQSTSAAHKLTNQLLTATPEISVIQAKAHQEVIEEITP